MKKVIREIRRCFCNASFECKINSRRKYCSKKCYYKSKIGKLSSLETSKKQSESMKKWHKEIGRSKETCEKISKSKLGKKRPKEFCELMSRILTGRKLPKEYRINIGLGRIGLKASKETCDKISKSLTGKKLSLLHRLHCSQSHIGKCSHKVGCLCNFCKIKRGELSTNHRGRKGYFWSIKNKCKIFYESNYELQAYLILESDNTVVKFGRCHFRVPYILHGKAHMYSPDIFVEYHKNKFKVIEVKASWEINNKDRKDIVMAKKIAAEEFCRQNGMEYEIWVEDNLEGWDKGGYMKFKSKVEKISAESEAIVLAITPKERDILIEFLKSLSKRAKLDRLDEFVLNDFIDTLENPEVEKVYTQSTTKILSSISSDHEHTFINKSEVESTEIDKAAIVTKIKTQADPQNKEDMPTWIKGSIHFAQQQMGIKSVPKSTSVEDFYDFLVENKIIDANGNPLPRK